MNALVGLQCHLCHTPFPAEALYVCDRCLGPLEPVYDYSAIHLTRDLIASRPKNLWRYRELLPIAGEPRTGFHSGFTPLVRCDRLADRLGLRELYIKDDSVNHPTLSYKDRVVSVAATRALELGFKVLACASTGNLANSVAAHAARLGVECCVFIPDNLEAGLDHPEPVRPDTIAKSIAIGNPADGYHVVQTVRETGGTGAAVTDQQLVHAIQLLAETEGIFTEPAGGTTLAAAIELVRRGVIARDESVVVCVTGNGYKTGEVVQGRLTPAVRLSRAFKEFEAWWETRQAIA